MFRKAGGQGKLGADLSSPHSDSIISPHWLRISQRTLSEPFTNYPSDTSTGGACKNQGRDPLAGEVAVRVQTCRVRAGLFPVAVGRLSWREERLVLAVPRGPPGKLLEMKLGPESHQFTL